MNLNNIWLGSEETYLEAQAAHERYLAHLQSGKPLAQVKASSDDEDDDPWDDDITEIVDGVAIITIQGSLLDGTFGWIGKWFGIVGYGDIQNALVKAVQNMDVRSIMLVIKSGGGAVSGVEETAALIQNVDAVKPVTTYSPSTMASAALWLGVAARKVYAGSTAIVGSIGTLTVVASRARQLKEDGIDAKVVRSGKYKALGHPVDELSEEALAEAQSKIDYLADMFLSYVADRRGVNKGAADAKFGQGRTFVGHQAQGVDLVDEVLAYSDAFVKTKSSAGPDNRPKFLAGVQQTGEISADNATQAKGTNMPHIPTPEELAAMAAAGIALESADADQEANKGETKAGGDNPDDPDAEDSSVTAKVHAEVVAQVATLTAALAEAQAAVAAAQATAEKAKTDADALVAQYSGLADIARNAIKTMAVATNNAVNVAQLPVEKLAATHAEMSEAFKAKFKVGGVAATKPEQQTTKQTAALVNPLFAHAAQQKRK